MINKVLHAFSIENKEFIRYLIVSLISLAVDLAIFSVCLRVLDLAWFTSATVSFVGGAVCAYYLSVLLVFSFRRSKKNPIKEFLIFLFIGVFGLGVTQITLLAGIEFLNLQAEVVKLFAAGLTFICNFILRKRILFTKS